MEESLAMRRSQEGHVMTSLQKDEVQMEYRMMNIEMQGSTQGGKSGVESKLTSVQGHYLPHQGQTG